MITNEELQNATRRKLIDPMIFFDEQWKKIDFIPGILPNYWISNYGRVYNESTGYVMDGHIIPNGYVIVTFSTIDGGKMYCHVHRTLMLAFYPIPDPENYVVNHKDGVKSHNWYWNLEWTTQKGNVEHAFETGLRKCGEDSSHAVFTNEQVHAVCKCMQDGMNLYELSRTVFGMEPNQQIRTLCINVYGKKFWKEISSQYDIDNYKRDRIFSVNQVHIICQCLIENKNMASKEILNRLQISRYSKEDYEVYNRAIWNIRRGKSFKEVTSLYNI